MTSWGIGRGGSPGEGQSCGGAGVPRGSGNWRLGHLLRAGVRGVRGHLVSAEVNEVSLGPNGLKGLIRLAGGTRPTRLRVEAFGEAPAIRYALFLVGGSTLGVASRVRTSGSREGDRGGGGG